MRLFRRKARREPSVTRYAQGMPVRFTALVPTSGQEG